MAAFFTDRTILHCQFSNFETLFYKLLPKTTKANESDPSDPSSDDQQIFESFTVLAALRAKGRRLRTKSQVKEPVSAIVVRFNAVEKNKRSEFFDCKGITELETVTISILWFPQKTTNTWTLGKRNARRVPSVERWEEKTFPNSTLIKHSHHEGRSLRPSDRLTIDAENRKYCNEPCRCKPNFIVSQIWACWQVNMAGKVIKWLSSSAPTYRLSLLVLLKLKK